MMMWMLRGAAALVIGVVLAIGLPDPAPAAPAVPSVAGLISTTNPDRVAAYFAGLSGERAWALAMNAPSAIGNLDGAPIALRYAANARDDGARYVGRQILGYQPGGDGRIIEVVGDLTSATRIAVLVPGSDTTLSDFDGGLGGVQRRAPAWQARQLWAASGRGIAVVAWLGYDTPKGIGRAAIRSEWAEAGADALVRFVDGLVVQCPHATVTVIGHSYGTVVLGHAAGRLPAAVTDLVALGSPGMDVSRAAELHTNARVWAGSDPTDWTLRLPEIRILGAGHATNPTAASFGALPLRVGDAAGHDGYFVSGSDALASIAGVVSGSTAASGVAS
jgi:pimeloyl-ACP methyl ester carboxylesterase